MEIILASVQNFFNFLLGLVDAVVSFFEGLSERAAGLLGGEE